MSNSNEQHVILGTGPLGLAVARELVKRNKRVRMVNRSGKANGILQGVELVTADLYNLDEVKRVPRTHRSRIKSRNLRITNGPQNFRLFKPASSKAFRRAARS